MKRPAPVTDTDRDQVRDLHAEGLSRNEIARRINRSGRTVSRIADELGLQFERGEQDREATEARKVDAKARRAALAVALLDDAERLRAALWAETKVYNFGGRDNTFAEQTLDEPPHGDKLKLMQAAGIAVTKAVELDRYDRTDGVLNGVDAWLAAMTGQDQ